MKVTSMAEQAPKCAGKVVNCCQPVAAYGDADDLLISTSRRDLNMFRAWTVAVPKFGARKS